MVKIRSFKGYVCNQSLAKKIIAHPYDIIEREEAKKVAEGNPSCFYHVNKPEIDLPSNVDQYDEKVYKKGKENLDLFIKNG